MDCPLVHGLSPVRPWSVHAQVWGGVKNQLHASKSRIHLSFDLWTSPNHFAIVSVVAHYMGPKFRVETTLLGLRRLRGNHLGKNIAEAVIDVVRTYGLTSDQIAWFGVDNATSNDTCVAHSPGHR